MAVCRCHSRSESHSWNVVTELSSHMMTREVSCACILQMAFCKLVVHASGHGSNAQKSFS
jgi:hypothetical protein